MNRSDLRGRLRRTEGGARRHFDGRSFGSVLLQEVGGALDGSLVELRFVYAFARPLMLLGVYNHGSGMLR